MRMINFRKVASSDLAKAHSAWTLLVRTEGPHVFIKCDKDGKHQPLEKVKNIWGPIEIIKRMSEGKPTKIFL